MKQKILITYASRSGSTAEIAEAIGKTLTQNGAQVDVLPMQEVTDLTPYQQWWPAVPFEITMAAGGDAICSDSSSNIDAEALRDVYCVYHAGDVEY